MCGVVGIKPTQTRVSRFGLMPLSFSFDCSGPLTRTVRDAARILHIISGHDPKDSTSSRRKVPDYELSELPQTKSGLDDALKMPSFQLNVRNQGPNKLLLFLVAMQLMTNVGLIAILWHKLG